MAFKLLIIRFTFGPAISAIFYRLLHNFKGQWLWLSFAYNKLPVKSQSQIFVVLLCMFGEIRPDSGSGQLRLDQMGLS